MAKIGERDGWPMSTIGECVYGQPQLVTFGGIYAQATLDLEGASSEIYNNEYLI